MPLHKYINKYNFEDKIASDVLAGKVRANNRVIDDPDSELTEYGFNPSEKAAIGLVINNVDVNRIYLTNNTLLMTNSADPSSSIMNSSAISKDPLGFISTGRVTGQLQFVLQCMPAFSDLCKVLDTTLGEGLAVQINNDLNALANKYNGLKENYAKNTDSLSSEN